MAHKRRVIYRLLWLGLAGLALATTVRGLLFPSHRPLATTGAYAITTLRDTFTDASRSEPFSSVEEKRRVNIVFWYPQNAGDHETFPLVLFSHGGLSTESSNESLCRELASHGYVVAAIGHPHHALYTVDKEGRVALVSMEYIQELRQEDARHDRAMSYHFYQKWMKVRLDDINFVMDTILQRTAQRIDGVYSLIDTERIGVMGHSLGGSAALGAPRQRDDIDAVIALEAPFLYDIVGVKNGEFLWRNEAYPVPVLNIYSDSSWGHLADWPQYARNAALLATPSKSAMSLHLPGGGHFSLTDLALVSPVLVQWLEGDAATTNRKEYLRTVNNACIAFFDHFLKDTRVWFF